MPGGARGGQSKCKRENVEWNPKINPDWLHALPCHGQHIESRYIVRYTSRHTNPVSF